MGVSRPILVALVAAVLALVAFYATSGSREAAEGPSEPAGADARPSPPSGGSRPGPKPDQAKGVPRSASAQPAGPDAARRPLRAGRSEDVSRAIARKRTVVLFFFQRPAADDAATARSVASLRGRPGVQVFSAPISRLGDYQAVIGGAGVSQAPAIVILGRDRAARLIEGFVDRETLAQHVADAR